MPNLIHGLDPGGGLRPIQVDDNGNLSVDLVSGVSVSTSITGTMTVDQLSGSAWSASVVSGASSLDVKQVSGSSDSVSASIDAQTVTLGVNQVSGSVFSTYITGSSGTAAVVGTLVAGAADVGDAPVKGGGIARTTNPGSYSDNQVVSSSHDYLGRQVITPYQVRDLIQTAYLAATSSAETALQAAVTSTKLDLVQVICANTSAGAVDIDFRSGTAGGIQFTVSCPANATAGFVPVVPFPQTEVASWTADIQQADLSGTTIDISATFIKNV